MPPGHLLDKTWTFWTFLENGRIVSGMVWGDAKSRGKAWKRSGHALDTCWTFSKNLAPG